MLGSKSTPLNDLVIDASLLAAWLLPDEIGPDFERLEKEYGQLRAPILLWAELRNILIIQERKGRITERDSNEALAIFEDLNIQFDLKPVGRDLMSLSRTYRLTVYDSLYLELALRTGSALGSLDKKLLGAAKSESLAVVS